MTIHYESLCRVKRVLEHASNNYQRLAKTRCTARGCEMYLDIARILMQFAKETEKMMADDHEDEIINEVQL